ncbi:hypothetical protein F511_27161 [Dorcoceras hygrometricum]|uniref:Bacterial transcriptional activator domain-containing protein n=1 Tax=Dorcoceras hygrometricum TaxID=472368 RepID=A0A2Z7D4P3_9LAMI|nr:hypothetical protein F511_27161 [Dorcoceras hygrometricum]
MSRYFFIKRISSRENPWGCDMSWRDDAHTIPPRTPEQATDLTTFLDAVREKCFNAHELIEEDLLCHFRFSWKKVPLVGDLGIHTAFYAAFTDSEIRSFNLRFTSADDRMTKAEMMKSLKEMKAAQEGTTSSRRASKGKRKVSSEEGGEDFDVVKGVPDLVVLEAVSLHFMQDLVWTGEATNRLSQARDEVVRTKRSMDGVLGRHKDLLKQLEEMRAQEDREKESLRLALEAARADAQSSKALEQYLEAKVALGGGEQGPPDRGEEAARGGSIVAAQEGGVPAVQGVRQPMFLYLL